ncbi:MAG: hypothetical protein JKY65_25135 [Planctomycetes bacterium]|nr:hypothetical protein [Planctomycetota bacterium]
MRALLLRELRRQGVYALGPTLAILIAGRVSRGLEGSTRPALDVFAPELWLLLLATVLGVATVAPDRGSGGHAFLRRLPLSLHKAFFVRVGAASLWLALGLTTTLVVLALRDGGLNLREDHALALGWPLAFGCGLVASTVTTRPLTAIGLSLPILGLLVTAFFGPLIATGLRPPGASSVVALIAVPALVAICAAFLAFQRGRLHLESIRPFAISTVALTGLGLVASGGIGLARTAHQSLVVPGLHPAIATTSGETALVILNGSRWYGREQRVLVVRPGSAPIAIPRYGARSPQLSPDGRQVLIRGELGWSQVGALFDVESGTLRDLDLGHSDAADVLWGGESPALVSLGTATALRIEAAVDVGQPRRLLTIALSEEARSVSVDARGRIYLLGPGGLRRLSGAARLEIPVVEPGTKVFPVALSGLALEEERFSIPAALAGGVRGLRVSPGGELALVLEGPARLCLFEVETGKEHALPALAGTARPRFVPARRSLLRNVDQRVLLGPYRVAFGPGERGVVVEHRLGGAFWLDRERGWTRAAASSETFGGLPSWASDGHAVLLGSGQVWLADEAAPRPLNADTPPLAWLGATQLVANGRSASGLEVPTAQFLTIFDPSTGTKTFPFGGAK